MKYEKTAASAAATAVLLAGCASPGGNGVENIAFQPGVVFEAEPETNYSVVDCAEDPHDWGTQTDESPGDQSIEPMQATLGGPEVPFRFGATIHEIGGVAARYQIATSEHRPGQSDDISLAEGPYSKVLQVDDNYSVVLSARLGADGVAYFDANCLPVNGHIGGESHQASLYE